MTALQNIPVDLINFLLVFLFSLVIGLEQRRHHFDEPKDSLFGMDRTFTLVAILGFILYRISPDNLILFGFGGIILSAFIAIYYYLKSANELLECKNMGFY